MGEKFSAATSFSHVFFEDYKLSKYLNTDCKQMLQFGAARGKFLEDYQKQGWSVTGYDYCASSIESLSAKEIKARQIDLNIINNNELKYHSELIQDISTPTNILLIRVLEYLEIPALNLLLFNLINHAAPGSVFFIAGFSKENEKTITPYTARYKASFFGPRTDMTIFVSQSALARDEILVVRKNS